MILSNMRRWLAPRNLKPVLPRRARLDMESLEGRDLLSGMGILVPSYIYPTPGGAWDQLAQAASQVPIMAIVNPDSGPGTSDPFYAANMAAYNAAVDTLHTAGGKAVGYVHTSYGARDINTVEAEIDAYSTDFHVDGIFIDEMTNGSETPGSLAAADLSYYTQIYNYIQGIQPTWTVVGNPGSSTTESYQTSKTADVLVTFENETGYAQYAPPAWQAGYPASTFSNMVLAVPTAAQMQTDVTQAENQNTGWMFVTDGNTDPNGTGNPYGALPSYWSQLITAVAANNVTQISGVTSSTPNGSYAAGSTISIQVGFSGPVTVDTTSGTPTLTLNSGGTATYASGSGTSTLTFSYTVAGGQNSGDLDYTSTSALTLNGGTIQDVNSNPAILTLAASGMAGSLGNANALLIDTLAPTSSVNSLPATTAGSIPVSWSGQDGVGGSRVATFDIYVQDNEGGYTLWLNHTAATSATFMGTVSHTYDFYSVATDNVGNVEVAAGTAQATTQELPLAPVFTSAASTLFDTNHANTFTFTTNSAPLATYSVVGTLPAGVTFDGSATISGTPAPSTGTYIVTVIANNGIDPPVSQTFSLKVIDPPTITTNPSTPISFTAGQTNTFTIATLPGLPAKTTFTEVGKLPTGVTFNKTTGVIAGKPASTGTFPITINATNGNSSSPPENFVVIVNGPVSAPTFTSASKATFVVGQTGTYTITSKGFPFATYSSTPLPAGLTLTDSGNGFATISGTPQPGTSGMSTVTLTAHNSSGIDAHQTFTLTVAQSPVITSANTALFTVGTASSFSVLTTPGFPTKTTFTEVGKLPTGVSFNKTTGVFSGTPAANTMGAYPVTITATNGSAPTVQSFVVAVSGPAAPPAFTSLAKATFVVGQAGTFTISTKGFPFAAISSTLLPAGLTLTSNGNDTATISGTPQAGTGGTHLITITANNGTIVTQVLTLTINQPPVFLSPVSTAFNLGQLSTFAVTTAGFPIAKLTESGTLPTGVKFVAHTDGTATLSGTPTVSGTFHFTITASNGVLPTAIQSFTLTVA